MVHYPLNILDEVLKKTQGMNLEGLVEGQGPVNPKIMLIGEAPGRDEVTNNIPFCGRAGKQLMSLLNGIGLTRQDVYITSTIRSRPYSIKKVINKNSGEVKVTYPNRTPNYREQRIFAPILDWEIENVKPDVIVTLGNTSLHRLVNADINISDVHGKVIKTHIKKLSNNGKEYTLTKRKYTVIPSYHPAAPFYNYKLQSVIDQDWKNIGNYIKSQNKLDK